jgi:hypothetical protein
MIQSPQTIQVERDGIAYEATVAWRYDRGSWAVKVDSSEFDPVEAQADDAFEALSLVREQLEPLGWRIGVAGAQLGVWPSGMSRDQGGGLTAYRMAAEGAAGIVETFEPVDPATVTTVTAQRSEIERLREESRRRAENG